MRSHVKNANIYLHLAWQQVQKETGPNFVVTGNFHAKFS
jgi:hypothetical protein